MAKAESLMNKVLHINIVLASDLSETKVKNLKKVIGQKLPKGSIVTASKSDITLLQADKSKQR